MISVMGTWMQIIGQAWLVLELTHSAWQLGLVGALQALPILLFSLFGGVFADRWPRQRVLLITQAASMLQAFALSRLYFLSIALIAGVGFMETIFATQALTMLQTDVPDHLRGRVMSVQVLFFDGSLPLGYVLMGWLSSLYGASPALLIGARLCLAVTGFGWLWRKPAEKRTV